MSASVSYQNVSNAVVVSFVGAIRDANFEEQLMDQFRSMKLEEQSCVIIDLSNVLTLPSSLLGAFIVLRKRMSGKLALCSAGVYLREQLAVTKLIEIFTIYENCEAALAKMT